MKKENREKLYKIGEVAELLGVHEDTLRNWEREGFIVPDRIGKRKDRRYTVAHIREIKEKGLVSDLAKKSPASKKDFEEYTKDELIKELQLLKKQKKYGLVWEDHKEEVVERCKTEAPILVSKEDKRIKDKDLSKPKNILIEGDNYHALQVLNYTHKNKIDVIYIDPPYNTGARDWRYNNDFVEGENPYRHTKWISFMSHRLVLAKKLLSNDGIICVTIDDYEMHRLWMLMEDVFGEFNHLGTVAIRNNPKGRMTKRKFSLIHEYAIFFGKSNNSLIKKLPVDPSEKSHNYKKDIDDSWYLPVNLRKQGVDSSAFSKKGKLLERYYPIYFDPKTKKISTSEKFSVEILPVDVGDEKRIWRRSKDVIEKMFEEGDLFVKETSKNGYQIYFKFRGGLDGRMAQSIWFDSKFSASDYGTKILDNILGKREQFQYPKAPEAVKESILAMSNKKDAVVLDFFAGSGTTGHAVLELNKEDGGSRKFILCTNNENKICEEVTWERIKRVSKGYTKPNGEKVAGLGGALEYFKTEFVDIENIKNVSDKKKLEFTHEAGQMIALKEDTFKEIIKNKYYQIFTDEKDKFVGIYFEENLDKLPEMEKKILDKKEVKIYIFSHGGNDFKNDYIEYKNVKVEHIPEPILKIYKSLNNQI